MPTINDPNGQAANVNNQGHLETESIVHSIEHFSNQVEQEAYQVPFAVNPDGAGDCFFYLKNNSDTDVIIEGFSYASSAAEEIYIELANTGIAVLTNGTIQIPANCNAVSGHLADVTCWSGTADEAIDITGLTNGREIERLWITAATDKVFHNFEMDIVLPKNTIFSMWCVGGDTNIRGTVVFYFHSTVHA